jgi:hypothetical protein
MSEIRKSEHHIHGVMLMLSIPSLVVQCLSVVKVVQSDETQRIQKLCEFGV